MWFTAAFAAIRGGIALVPPVMWKYIAIAIAFGAVFVYADRKATYRERAACELAAQRAQKAADAQDAKAERELRVQAEATVDNLSTQRTADNALIEHLKVQLAKAPLNAPCYYPDAAPAGRVRARKPG